MSKAQVENAIVEETFATKLGIEMVSPRTFREMIDLNAGSTNVVCAVGPSGIGKTAIPIQAAKARNGGKGVPYAAIYMPTATQEGFFVPTTASDTKAYFDQRVPRTFQAILEWSDKMIKKYGKAENVPADMCAILSIEEINRAPDKSVTRAAFVMIGDRMIGDVPIPQCIQIVATMNPTGGGMSVNEFERDPAMRRRLSPMIGVSYNYGDFMEYAMRVGFHEHVLAHLGAQPSHGYDEQAALAGKHFACPATWETVSRLCFQFEARGLKLDTALGRAAIAGAVGSASATAFLEYIRDNTLVITPEDVLTKYLPGSETQKRFRAYTPKGSGEDGDKGGRLDKVSALAEGLVTYIFAHLDKAPGSVTKQLACFMGDLALYHVDQLTAFTRRLTNVANDKGVEAKNFLQALNQTLAHEPAFVEAMRTVHQVKLDVQKAIQDEE